LGRQEPNRNWKMKSKRLYITMSIFILLMVGGGTILGVSFREDIQIRWYIYKLDSGDVKEKEKAFEWLYKKAKKNPDDERLKGFYSHRFSFVKASLINKIWSLTPLGLAVFGNNMVYVKILLAHNVDVNGTAYDVEMTPLERSIRMNHEEIATVLRNHGAMTGAELREKQGKKK